MHLPLSCTTIASGLPEALWAYICEVSNFRISPSSRLESALLSMDSANSTKLETRTENCVWRLVDLNWVAEYRLVCVSRHRPSLYPYNVRFNTCLLSSIFSASTQQSGPVSFVLHTVLETNLLLVFSILQSTFRFISFFSEATPLFEVVQHCWTFRWAVICLLLAQRQDPQCLHRPPKSVDQISSCVSDLANHQSSSSHMSIVSILLHRSSYTSSTRSEDSLCLPLSHDVFSEHVLAH